MMKTLAKLISMLIPFKKYRKPFLKRLEDILWCGDNRNVYIWKIRKTAKSVGKHLKVTSTSKVNKNTTIGDYVLLHGMKIAGKGNVEIGSHVIAAGDCLIVTENHNYEGEEIPYDDKRIYKDVKIGDFVWIGVRVLILPGTTIGEGAIIQGGAVVHGDIPSGAIVGGNPAKVFKYRDMERFNQLKAEQKFHW
ncbi:MAG: acyltransferase [Rhodospirillales bacterium]|nr:acyltransferase [Rhodospirillales bacterium]